MDIQNIQALQHKVENTKPQRKVIQMDGDMIIYLASGNDETPFHVAKGRLRSMILQRSTMAKATHCNFFVTGIDKGDRHAISTIYEYQANRKGKVKPKNHALLKSWILQRPNLMSSTSSLRVKVCIVEGQEADDAMVQAQVKAGYTKESIIHSGDKDLRMVKGWHMDWKTFEIVNIQDGGYLTLTKGEKGTKLSGYGVVWFFAQMLIGDKADNIAKGNMFNVDIVAEYMPTKAYLSLVELAKAKGRLPTGKLASVSRRQAMKNPKSVLKPKKIGDVGCFVYLRDAKTIKDVIKKVQEAYKDIGVDLSKDYRGKALTGYSWFDYYKEVAQLLWMRRYIGENIKEVKHTLSDPVIFKYLNLCK